MSETVTSAALKPRSGWTKRLTGNDAIIWYALIIVVIVPASRCGTSRRP